MDVTAAKTPTSAVIKTHEPDAEARTVPKRLQAPPLDLHGHGHGHHPVVVTYKECMKNHAAAAGGHSVDGCGEYMPSPTSNQSEPASLRCAACGCHRNFHRREHDGGASPTPPHHIHALEYHPYHRHLPPPPHPNSPSLSPPPISSAYPHGLLSLRSGGGAHHHEQHRRVPASGLAGKGSNGTTRKRCRTKFTQQQKAKMLELAEMIGWKMQKRDEDAIVKTCGEIGVERWVFKVWMHNNKNPRSCKKDQPSTTINKVASSSTMAPPYVNGANANGQEIKEIHQDGHHEVNSKGLLSGSSEHGGVGLTDG